MATHLAARLVWHDRGWDGRICNAPADNGWCIRYEWIREGRQDGEEGERQGKKITDAFLPPCVHDANAFARSSGYTLQHTDPLYRRFLSPSSETLESFSFVTAPFRRMREERGWVYDPEEQKALLDDFFDALEKNRSLVFFYGMHGNPIDEDSDRVLFGVGRITDVEDLQYFGGADEDGRRYPIWWRKITHAGETEGVRLPYQEYLDADPSGQAGRRILCRVPSGARPEFSYVGEHVGDDTAIAVLERLDKSLAQVERDGITQGPWRKARAWIQTTLAELWRERGAFPGIPAVLAHLGVERAEIVHRTLFVPLEREGKDPRELLFPILEGKREPNNRSLRSELIPAAVEWQDKRERTRDLLRLLIRFDLTKEQVDRVAIPAKRRDAGIDADEAAIISNPYLLVESDLGEEGSAPVGFEAIDHGMLPDREKLSVLADPPIGRNDRRRTRALLVQTLRTAADQGDTFLPLTDALTRAVAELPESRQIDGDPERFLEEQHWHAELITPLGDDAAPQLITLTRLRDMEGFVGGVLEEFVVKRYPKSSLDWSRFVAEALEEADPLSEEVEARARAEKIAVLEQTFTSRLSVITGRAGTGKTTVVRALLEGIEEAEGKHSSLLLTPTGKARARLQARTNHEAATIHSFLARNKWLHEGTFSLKWGGGEEEGARTVIIDEASMLPIDLIAVLLKALKREQVRRLILVGDPNQLPPIGPGRPLADIIDWLDHDDRRHALGHLRERARAKDVQSEALQLSDLFTSEPPNASDDDILVRASTGALERDLEVHFWTDAGELEQVLFARLGGFLDAGDGEKEYEAFNRSLRDGDQPAPDRWQILSPVRGEGVGTEQLNRLIQFRFHGGLLRRRGARPLGAQQIVYLDKIMQIRNARRRDVDGNMCYVANGDVGLVVDTWAKTRTLKVAFAGQEAEIRYSGKADVEDNLELAYATTVHKAQGSDFDTVFLVVPRDARKLSRELLYTAITRFQSRLVLLLEGDDVGTLERFSRPEYSDTARRNTFLFELTGRPDLEGVPYPERRIHRAKSGIWVRSKSELIVARALDDLGLSYEYERRLADPDNPKWGYLPDFTIFHEGETYYWEHLGMLDQSTYNSRWERKRAWYEANGFADELIISKDGAGGSIDEQEIERIARERILGN
jgi:exodeoxyribonuclease V alpha subunit